MNPGDLILTPSWPWRDHGNETDETVVWLDGLDVPLAGAPCIFFQIHDTPKAEQAAGQRVQAPLRHGHLAPSWIKERPRVRRSCSTRSKRRWRRSRSCVKVGAPYEGVALEYTNPQTGGPLTPTSRAGSRSSVAARGSRCVASPVAPSSTSCKSAAKR